MKKLLTIILISFLLSTLAFAGNVKVLDISAKHYFHVDDNGSNDLDVTGDFTIEAWVKCNDFTGRLCDRSGVMRIYPTSNSIRFDLDGGGSISTGTVSTGVWNHIAVSRSGTTTRIFLNGEEKASANFALTASTVPFYVCGDGGYFPTAWDAQIDEFRFSDIARYTSNFSPSTSDPAFSSDANTILLYNFDVDTDLPPANSSSYSFTHTNDGIVQGDYAAPTDLPLPITLSSFTANAVNGTVELDWETATETNNANFVIYRNAEGIATIAGAGTTTEPQYYSYVDNTVVPGVTYTYVLADVDYANEETRYEGDAVTVTTNDEMVANGFEVGAAYPNPFNPMTLIPLELARDAKVTATLYDLNGREIRRILNSTLSAGAHTIHIDGSNMTTGLYLVQILVDDILHVQKISLMK
ncbi:MAG: LamG-like jellyroll fold domain-containing protein [Candidatus Marinimicrobia bacterium]|nr:LamG-like jellyroll fold domain-containing protein [Candidatus Neomarinimicrobiota bacterium]